MAVANDARKVEIETPSFFFPVPPAFSRAVSRFEDSMLQRMKKCRCEELTLCNAMQLKQSKVEYQRKEQRISRGIVVQTSQNNSHEFKRKNRHVENETPESIVVATKKI